MQNIEIRTCMYATVYVESELQKSLKQCRQNADDCDRKVKNKLKHCSRKKEAET